MGINRQSDPLKEPLDADRLTIGEATLHRRFVTSSSVVTGSTSLRLSFFTARKTETITQIRLITGATAAGATPTLVRSGIYSVAGNGDIALVASITNDTTIFAASITSYTRTLTSSFAKVAGTRYAIGTLVVTGATAPTVHGWAALTAAETGMGPRLAGLVGGQSDLPASVVSGSIGDTGQNQYSVLLP